MDFCFKWFIYVGKARIESNSHVWDRGDPGIERVRFRLVSLYPHYV